MPERSSNTSPPRRAWRRFRRNRRALVGLTVITLIVLVAFFAPLIAGSRPIACRFENRLYFPAIVAVAQRIPFASSVIKQTPPFSRAGFEPRTALDQEDFAIWPIIPYGPLELTDTALDPPSSDHWLGTDESGRDIAARLIHAAVVSVQVGLVSMGIAGVVGIVIGGLAGYFGRWVDAVISRVIEVVICFPDFFLILSVMVWLEPSIVNVMVVIGLTRWTSIARYTRGEFLRLKHLDFVAAARVSGAGHLRIMVRHLLPNALAPILVTITFGVASAVLIESALSWLGFGVQPPNPSWGNMLRSAYINLRVAPHMVYPPCIAIFVTVLVYNLVGDALRDAIDPRTAERRR